MTELEALRAVAKAARECLIAEDEAMNNPQACIRAERELAEALAALVDAEPDGWRPDRPGWYYVKYSKIGGWAAANYVLLEGNEGNIPYWIGANGKPVKIGPALPPPPASAEEDK